MHGNTLRRANWFFPLVALTHAGVNVLLYRSAQQPDAENTLFHAWVLLGIVGLSWYAYAARTTVHRFLRWCAVVWIGAWLACAYAFLFTQQDLLSTIVWIAAPSVCAAVVLCVSAASQKTEDIATHSVVAPSTQRTASWKYIALIGVILAIAASLRVYHLGNLGYSTDEGSTALYAWAINNTGTPCHHDICYVRGLPYLYTVAGVTHLFGNTEFWVRSAGVIIELLGLGMSLVLIQQLWKRWRLTVFAASILAIADWQLMLGRYARMYGTMLLFMLIAFWAYTKAFTEKRYRYIPLLCVASAVSMLTHQFGMLLIFFIIEPFLTRRFALYKNPYFIAFGLFLLAMVGMTLTKVPGIIYTSDAYRSLYELRPDLAARDAYWYLANLQLPNLVYVKNLFIYYPVSLAVFAFATATLIARKHTHRWIALFGCWIVFVTTIYRIDYALKYLWWILAVLHIVVFYGIYTLYRQHRVAGGIASVLLIAQLIGGATLILQREPGSDTTRLPILAPTHVEAYAPDDKTPAEYVAAHAAVDDIVITDYWMQNVYLQLAGHRMSEGHMSQWDDMEFLRKFPYYQLYDDNGTWRLEQNGPEQISSAKDLVQFLREHEDHTVWYISSVDFSGRSSEYISTTAINKFIQANFGTDVVYTGLDHHTVVYKLTLQ